MRLSDENTREGRHLTPEERIALQAEEIKQKFKYSAISIECVQKIIRALA